MDGILVFLQSHIFELSSVLGIVGALLFSAWQNSLTARSIRAQSFVNLLVLENDSGFQHGIRAITSLKPYTSFAAFDAGEDPETKQAIYDAVVYLNAMAALGEQGYVHMQDAWDVYFWSYRTCFDKLLPWWLEGYRATQPSVFPSFEHACRVTHLVTAAQIARFEKKTSRTLKRRYHHSAHVPRAKLRSVFSRPSQPPTRPTS
jgi:hypothetical protein